MFGDAGRRPLRREVMRYGRLKKSDLDAVATITGAAFSFPAAEAETWLSNAGTDQLRVVREGGRVVGSLLLIPMGQYFGGKSVPMVGIAGVGVGIADRGRGVARALMAGTVQELAERGVALSTLYASTQTLYRSVGYERAGKLMLVRAATSVFSAPRTKLIARTLGETTSPPRWRSTARSRLHFTGTSSAAHTCGSASELHEESLLSASDSSRLPLGERAMAGSKRTSISSRLLQRAGICLTMSCRSETQSREPVKATTRSSDSSESNARSVATPSFALAQARRY